MNDGNYYYTPQEPPRKPQKISTAGIIGIIIASAFALVILSAAVVGGIFILRTVGSYQTNAFQDKEASTDDGRQEFSIPDIFGDLPFSSETPSESEPDTSAPSSEAVPSSSEDAVAAPTEAKQTDLSSSLHIASGGTVLSNSEIYSTVAPSVVGIVITDANGSGGSGSGIVMTEDGYILTNAHVVSDAATVTVTLYDGSEYGAVVVGADDSTDIAVIQINAKGLTPATFGDSDSVQVGEDAIAIGNPLGLELSFTMTRGIISAINRNIAIEGYQMTLLQTDASINPGNSGGPLVNNKGQVIGVTSAKIMNSYSSSSTVEGIGFAIPSNTALEIAKDLAANGKVTGRAYLGITIQTQYVMSSGRYTYCVVVAEVVNDGPAAKAGIQAGDIILSFNGTEVTTNTELLAARDLVKPGDTVKIVISRNGQEMTMDMTLGES